MVRTLNTILLTTSELFELRMRLKDITNEVIVNEFVKTFVSLCVFNDETFMNYRNQLPYLSAFICHGRTVPFQLYRYAY